MSLTRVKEGLSAISADVLEDVRKEAEALILQAESEAKEALRAAKEEADKTYASIMEDASSKAEAEKRKIQSLTEVEVRNRLLQAKESLIDAAFEKATKNLIEFAKTDAYHKCLLRLIQQSSKRVPSKELIVYANAADKAWLEKGALEELAKKTHKTLKLAKETENFVGGCKIETEDGKVTYDNTIENRLEQLKPALRSDAARILFAEEEQ